MSDLSEEINRIINKAKDYFQVAKELLESGNFEHAVSRAYYTVFHGMVAILFSKKMRFSSHAAVIAKFREYFIKTGIFPKEYSYFIGELFEDRQDSDYDYYSEIDEVQAKKDVENAGTVLNGFINYLKEKNLYTE